MPDIRDLADKNAKKYARQIRNWVVDIRASITEEGDIELFPFPVDVGLLDNTIMDTRAILNAQFVFRFDLNDPVTEQLLRNRSALLAKHIDDELRSVVQERLALLYAEKQTPKVWAKELKSIIGLTEDNAKTLKKYEATLRSSGVKEPRVAELSKKYADKMVARRAETIALTELHTATAESQRQYVKQAIGEGRLEGFEYEWLTAPDERRCPACGAMHGERAPLDRGFPNPVPLHPRCRCREILVRK